MKIFAVSLGLAEDYFEQYTNNPFWIFRVIGYPPLPRDNKEVGTSCGTHTDYGMLNNYQLMTDLLFRMSYFR